MSTLTIRDRLWLWGMMVNALQETETFGGLGFGESTMTTEQAIDRTGIRNVLLAGGLALDRPTLASMPSARRVIAKHSLHGHDEHGEPRLDLDGCITALRQAKQIAGEDRRVDAYLIDDFSTASIAAGAKPEHLARLQNINASEHPHLPLLGAFYEMSLDDERMLACLPYFAGFLSPLWHAADIDNLPGYIQRIGELSGGKPQLTCIYLYDFGNQKFLTYEQMQRQLDVAEQMLRAGQVVGICILGTCMMDLDWESNRCFYDWLDRAGDQAL